ncbi:hypothetical protein BU23DRAFT_67370 [Bimuria novae-zelandiae CBS 107.79]|uniref:Uncharacterized protein n=1 Tax=Bimuria novae-zelandiae CBS 107.79 TaxID=1447943 RepID=A0A6A5VF53_9PLEO|nr:hypothetical protein BU23DRAFT_67370 [Bimuria novae-zelandiae CBS 107.79]
MLSCSTWIVCYRACGCGAFLVCKRILCNNQLTNFADSVQDTNIELEPRCINGSAQGSASRSPNPERLSPELRAAQRCSEAEIPSAPRSASRGRTEYGIELVCSSAGPRRRTRGLLLSHGSTH